MTNAPTTFSTSDRITIAIDIGGTFTDITLIDKMNGAVHMAKTPSTPADPSIGFMNGVERILQIAHSDAGNVDQIFHGTTVATNLILENKGALTGLITTRGFRHVLEIGRHDVPRKANLYSWIKPKRPIPPERIEEIGGRFDFKGNELEPLDEGEVRQAAKLLRDKGVQAIAICLLHSYVNSSHERRVSAIVGSVCPDLPVSISSEVLPVYREYERCVATILNAYCMPALSTYIGHLEKRLTARGISTPLLLMKSSGGVAGAETIRREPIQTALSGPAAGVIGAAYIAEAANQKQLITIDIGGTSADICLVQNGQPGMSSRGHVGDWPVRVPMLDIETIGAGGGSIATVTDTGNLVVGPASAGAVPGPACYGRGGTEPTVTDAHLVLGHLLPRLLNGEMRLDFTAAETAIRRRIAEPLGIDIFDAARGIIDLVNNNMVGAVRVISVERGYDPADFTLLPFGGAGPLHSSALARLLRIKKILVPPAPGVLASLGLLVSRLKADFSRTCVQHPPNYNIDQIRDVFSELESNAKKWMARENIPEENRVLTRQASLRYRHQGNEITVDWHGSDVDPSSIATTLDNFHEAHERLYTFAQRDTPVEIVSLHATAIGQMPKPRMNSLPRGGKAEDAMIQHHVVRFGDGDRNCPVFDRANLRAGHVIEGPAIVQQLDCTTLIFPNERAETLEFGSMLIAR